MHHVTELVKVGLHLVVLQQRGPSFPGLGEIGDHRRHGEPAFSLGSSAAGLQAEAGGVAVLSLPCGSRCKRCEMLNAGTFKGGGARFSDLW